MESKHCKSFRNSQRFSRPATSPSRHDLATYSRDSFFRDEVGVVTRDICLRPSVLVFFSKHFSRLHEVVSFLEKVTNNAKLKKNIWVFFAYCRRKKSRTILAEQIVAEGGGQKGTKVMSRVAKTSANFGNFCNVHHDTHKVLNPKAVKYELHHNLNYFS